MTRPRLLKYLASVLLASVLLAISATGAFGGVVLMLMEAGILTGVQKYENASKAGEEPLRAW